MAKAISGSFLQVVTFVLGERRVVHFKSYTTDRPTCPGQPYPYWVPTTGSPGLPTGDGCRLRTRRNVSLVQGVTEAILKYEHLQQMKTPLLKSTKGGISLCKELWRDYWGISPTGLNLYLYIRFIPRRSNSCIVMTVKCAGGQKLTHNQTGPRSSTHY